MTKFYTRTGDDGTTGLLGAERARKDEPRLEVIGTIDETNAILGVARAVCKAKVNSEILLAVQRDLYNVMSEVGATPDNASRFRKVGPERVSWLEEKIEEIAREVEQPGEFIVPGDTYVGGILDLARTIVRRAERRISGLYLNDELRNPEILRYFNRLSSLCFVLELMENQLAGHEKPTLAKK